MKLCTLLFVIGMTCSGTEGLRCYQQLGNHMSEQDCSTVTGASALGGQMACSKIVTDGNVVRTCAPNLTGENGCTSALGATACFCSTDLCNTGSNTRTANIFHFLMVLVAMVVSTRCIKSAFIWSRSDNFLVSKVKAT